MENAQRQLQKLNDGLNFLERQKSVLEDEKEKIEIELANFRTENNQVNIEQSKQHKTFKKRKFKKRKFYKKKTN